MEVAQRAAKGIDLSFVSVFLPLGQFESLENFLHIIERLAQ
jgi:hypothetical protein